MKRSLIISLIFQILFLCHSYAYQDYIIAKVNNKAITKLELDDRYGFVLFSSKIKVRNALDKKLLMAQILDKMVDEELIRQEAQRIGINVSQNEVNSAANIIASRQKITVKKLKATLANKGLSFASFLSQVKSEILWSKITSNILKPRVKVSEVEIREFFEQQNMVKDATKYHIAEILILSTQKKSQQFAQKIFLELKEGADFEKLSDQFSSSVFKSSGGEIGWVFKSDIDNRIYQNIAKLRKGSYSKPLKLDDGYHIFKLIDSRLETDIFSKENIDMVKKAILARKLQTLSKSYLLDLRKKSYIEIKL